jgi:hypothetical protein
LTTLSTETLAYPGGIATEWILGVLVGSIGDITPVATLTVAFLSGICSSQDVNGAVTSSTRKRIPASSSCLTGTSVEALEALEADVGDRL